MEITMKITDMHTHILYGVDDGARSLTDSLDLISEEQNQGVQQIFLTPHYGYKFGCVDRKLLEKRFLEIQEKASKYFPDMKLYLGSELYYERNTIQHLKEGKALTMSGSRYVLVEFGVKDSYSNIFQAVYDLVYAGYLPIIAHVERYSALRNNSKAIEELVKSGAYLQVNAGSFLKGFPSRKAAFCKKLIKEELVYFIGSDCHDVKVRSPNMKEAYDLLDKRGILLDFNYYAEKVIRKSYI